MDFYEGMEGLAELEGLYDSLAGIKEDAMEFGTIAATALVSAGIAKFVVGKAKEMLPAGAAADYGAPVIPIAVGLFLGGYLRGFNDNVAKGVAVGMISYGVAKLVEPLLGENKSLSPFSGVGEYDYASMSGFGYYPMAEGNYLNAAPVSAEDVSGFGAEAPVSVEEVSGFGSEAPVSVEEVHGLAATF